MRSAFLFVLLTSLTACAQEALSEKPVIIVGVASPANESRAIFQADWERDQMVRDINNQSAHDKKSPAKIQAVALHGNTLEEVGEEARSQNCSYIVLTTASENIGVAGYDSAPGVPNPMKPAPDTSPGAATVLGVKYSISRTGEPGPVSHGSILAPGMGDGFGQSAIQGAFRDLATRIFNEVRRQKPVH